MDLRYEPHCPLDAPCSGRRPHLHLAARPTWSRRPASASRRRSYRPAVLPPRDLAERARARRPMRELARTRDHGGALTDIGCHAILHESLERWETIKAARPISTTSPCAHRCRPASRSPPRGRSAPVSAMQLCPRDFESLGGPSPSSWPLRPRHPLRLLRSPLALSPGPSSRRGLAGGGEPKPKVGNQGCANSSLISCGERHAHGGPPRDGWASPAPGVAERWLAVLAPGSQRRT